MKTYEWDKDKNQKLMKERGISFEAVVSQIEAGNIVAVASGKDKFKHQKQFLIQINKYIYVVPFVENEEKVFLKTIIPSRKLTKRYLAGGN